MSQGRAGMLRRVWEQAWVRYLTTLAVGLAGGTALGLLLAQRPWVLLARAWRTLPDEPPFDILLQ